MPDDSFSSYIPLNTPVDDGWTAVGVLRGDSMKVPVVWVEFSKAGEDTRYARHETRRNEGVFTDSLPGKQSDLTACKLASTVSQALRGGPR